MSVINSGWIRAALGALTGAAVIALGAWLQFPIPGTTIPQTGQTIAVLGCGALLGSRLGGLAVLLYLLTGALGLPIFSDGASGWQVLTGPNAGYFAGFAVSAMMTGRLLRTVPGGSIAFGKAVLILLAGHGLILLLGGAWLARSLGMAEAYQNGIAPFYYGALVKSVLTAMAVVPVWRFRRARGLPHQVAGRASQNRD